MAEGTSKGHDGTHVTLGINTPMDMFRKLRWECDKVQYFNADDPMGMVYSAMNAAITAWQLGDWVANALTSDDAWTLAERLFNVRPMSSKADLQRAMRGCEALLACQQIATAGKHYKIEARAFRPGFRADRHDTYWIDDSADDGYDRAIIAGQHLSVVFPTTVDNNRRISKQHGIRLVLDDASAWWEATLKGLAYLEEN
jgi:hypothetical protein